MGHLATLTPWHHWGMANQGFSANPFDVANANLRAGTADREELARILGVAFAEGKLDDTEYEERLDSALQIKLLGEVRTHLIDLGSPKELLKRPVTAKEKATELKRVRRKRNAAVVSSLGTWAAISVLMNVIWLLTTIGTGDPQYYWPIWPMLGVGIPMIITSVVAWQLAAREEGKIISGADERPQLPGPFSN